jgi:hypothetical protein
MKIVHSFWTKTLKTRLEHFSEESSIFAAPAEVTKSGWPDLESLIAYTHWSYTQALKLYGEENLVLVTDSFGKELFVERLGFKYGHVSTMLDQLDDFEFTDFYHYPKILAYEYMQEPFLHIDMDLVMFKPLPPQAIQSGVVIQNLEGDYLETPESRWDAGCGYTPGWGDYSYAYTMLTRAPYIPEPLKNQAHLKIVAHLGIFGGRDLDFIKRFCSLARKFVEHEENQKYFKELTYLRLDMGIINKVIERALLASMLLDNNYSPYQVIPGSGYVDANMTHLHKGFTDAGILHLMDAKSRPDVIKPVIEDHLETYPYFKELLESSSQWVLPVIQSTKALT